MENKSIPNLFVEYQYENDVLYRKNYKPNTEIKQMKLIDFNLQPEILENDLIKISALRESDFERLFSVASDPLIWEQHPDRDSYKRESFQKFFDSAINSKSGLLIFDQSTNTLIGSTRYHDYNPMALAVGIGYTFLDRKYWGGRYNKALKKLMLDYAFEKVDSVTFQIEATNIRAQQAILKIGAAKINTLDFELNGVKIPVFEFGIKKQRWRTMNSTNSNSVTCL